MIPLAYAAPGESGVVRKIGGPPALRQHLEDLGFVVGGDVTVVNSLNGNIIVNIRESRIASSEEMARKIMI